MIPNKSEPSEPTLNPLPWMISGIPHANPARMEIADIGKNIRSGLKNMTILTISMTVSIAVL